MQYLFFPFAFLMGVALEDCAAVSRLIGTKIFVNEFVLIWFTDLYIGELNVACNDPFAVDVAIKYDVGYWFNVICVLFATVFIVYW